MIEIEVEMDTNVLAAEATSNAVNITLAIWMLSLLPWENDTFHWEIRQFWRLLLCRKALPSKFSKLWSWKILKRYVSDFILPETADKNWFVKFYETVWGRHWGLEIEREWVRRENKIILSCLENFIIENLCKYGSFCLPRGGGHKVIVIL